MLVYGVGNVAPAGYLFGAVNAGGVGVALAGRGDLRAFADDQSGIGALAKVKRTQWLAFIYPEQYRKQIQQFRELDAFAAGEGQPLQDFALWCALEEHYEGAERPAEAWDIDSPLVEALRAQLADRVRFHVWLQWLCDQQLERAQAAAVASGMAIGVMHDLAVGVHRVAMENGHSFDTLALTPGSRAVLRGDAQVMLREATASAARRASSAAACTAARMRSALAWASPRRAPGSTSTNSSPP